MRDTDDSPLARLGRDAYLQPHHLAAAQRLEALVERGRMTTRVTMSYDPTRVGARRGGGNATSDLSVSAAAARQQLNRLATAMPGDCWGVVFDVCGLGKGLQLIETERQWPRRSAKLVLRIALEQLAGLFGLAPVAAGLPVGRTSAWLPERPPMFADATTDLSVAK